MSQITEALRALAENLPQIAEEGYFSTKISSEAIIQRIAQSTGSSNDYVAAVIDLQQQYWASLGLLDSRQLSRGYWQFTSFPASLVAKSILQTVGQKRPKLLDGGWWTNENFLEDQRKFLIELEERRIAHQSSNDLRPIRAVQVAWALIKLDGLFLMNHREDANRPDVPNYVFIGGRLNLNDLLEKYPEEEEEVLLSWHQTPDWSKVKEALEITLTRELEEELGFYPKHFTVRRSHQLPTYQKMEGARANHALTRYDIVAYEVELTDEGFRHLCTVLKDMSKDQLIFASPEEIISGNQADRKLFVSAWTESVGQKELIETLSEFPESYEMQNEPFELVDIPYTEFDRIKVGGLGREKPIDIPLTEEEVEILQIMAWQRINGSNTPITPQENIILYPLGWFEIHQEYGYLIELLRKLNQKFNEKDLNLLQGNSLGWFRIRNPVDTLFFQDDFFEIEPVKVDDKWFQLHFHVEEIKTIIGTLPKTTLKVETISENLYHDIKSILDDQESEVLQDFNRSLRLTVNRYTRKFGLRLPIRKEGINFITNCRIK